MNDIKLPTPNAVNTAASNNSNMPELEVANNALTAKMIYETQRRKYDTRHGTTIFAQPGKNSINPKNAINDINTIYTGHRIYTQLTLACAKLEFGLIEKIIELGADVNLSPLNYYLDNKPYEKDEGLTVFHNSPLYELLNAIMLYKRFEYDASIVDNFKKTIQLFIRKGATFTYNTPFNLYSPTHLGEEYKNGFDHYVIGLKIPLKFLVYLNYNKQYVGGISKRAIGDIIYELICQTFTEDSSNAKEQFLKGDLSVLRDDLQKTFLRNQSYNSLLNNSKCLSAAKGGSKSRKNRKKRNARSSKTTKR